MDNNAVVRMLGLKKGFLPGNSEGPLVCQPETQGQRHVLAGLVESHRQDLHDALLEHGAVLFRGFDVNSVDAFSGVVDAVGRKRLDYVHRSTPRTAIGDRVFTATEYPAPQEIPLHSENAYLKNWPLALAFCCVTPAQAGGETPIANLRRITALIGAELIAKFSSLGVRYVRHYRPYIDLPWQTVFQTNSREELANLCREQGIDHQWLDADTLRTTYTAQGVAVHPLKQFSVFFNQAHLFHISSVGAESAQALIETFGRDRVPRHSTFGDGSEIAESELAIVRNAFKECSISFSWQAGDVLLLDNMQFAHGRRPYKGPRKVIAALLGA